MEMETAVIVKYASITVTEQQYKYSPDHLPPIF
jgi:hypothetical protein